ncbi:hypothetical protein MPSEU_000816700 [Mayamaea pseudoterrestris]|nr:hypothetical protein MPSEU_000816700 [Mayamaea pseudoterrestris]
MNRANRLTFTTAAVRSDLWMTTQRSLLVGSHCVSFGERWNGMAEWLLDEYDLKVGLLMLEVRSWKGVATPDHPLAVHTIHESQYGMESVDLGASLTAVAKLTCLTSSAMAASTGNARAPITAGDALPVASENLLLSVINMSLDQGSIDSFAKETVQGQQMPVEFDVNSPPFFDDLAAGDHKSTGAIAITSSPEVMDWSASQALRPKVHTALSLTSGRNAHSWPSVQGDMANIKLPTKNTISAAHDRPHKLATTIADGLRGPITEVPVPLTSAGPTLEVMASGLTGFANATRVNAKTNGHIPPSPDKENQTKAFPGHNARFDKFAPPFGEKELVDSAILVHDNTLAAKGCEDDTLTENGFLSRKADQKGFCGSDFHGVESPQHEYLPFAIGEGNDDNGFSMCNDDEDSNLQTDDAMDQSPTAHSNVDDFEAHNDGLISSVPAHDAVSRRFLNGVGFNSDRRSITDLNKHSNDCSFPNEGNDNPPTALDDGGSKLDTSPDFSDALLHKTILYIEKGACLPRYLTWGTECRFRNQGLTDIVKDILKGGGKVFYDERFMPHNLTNLNDVGWEKTGRAGLCKVFKCKQKSKSSKKGTGRHPPFPKVALKNCETLYDRLIVINWWLNLPRAERQTTLEKLGGNRHIVAAERCRLETQSAS